MSSKHEYNNNNNNNNNILHVKYDPCHRGMACPQVVNGVILRVGNEEAVADGRQGLVLRFFGTT
jgi:hypothetical protein